MLHAVLIPHPLKDAYLRGVRATLAAIADAATVGAGDKLNVAGVFDTIFARAFPAVHPEMVLVIRLQLEAADAGREHRVRVALEDERGKRLFEQTARTKVYTVPPGEAPSTNVVCRLSNTSFAAPGRYRFSIAVGRTRLRLPLRVVRREA